MPNRSIRDERETPSEIAAGDPDDAPVRNKVGPADPDTRDKALAARLAEREPVDSRPSATPVYKPNLTTNPTRNIRVAKQRRDDQLEAESK